MARWDGSGDISFTREEFRRIGEAILKACDDCPPDGYLTLSKGIQDGKTVVADIRYPRFRGPVDELGFELRPFRR